MCEKKRKTEAFYIFGLPAMFIFVSVLSPKQKHVHIGFDCLRGVLLHFVCFSGFRDFIL